MALNFLALPPELLIKILGFLTLKDLLSCERCCSQLRQCFTNSTFLQYLAHLEIAGVEDDHRPGLSYSERLDALTRREIAWKNLEPTSKLSVTVPFHSTGIYDFTGGAFLLGTRLHEAHRRPTFGYSYLRLPPSTELACSGIRKWSYVDLQKPIIDIGLAVHEHDLIAVMTA